ncbi:hypothetical protein LOTGIDRAFT_162365 [Lottia gigantea]|uniref:Solute carrier family 25 member 7 n=1 Tax=Lottia gigantea TaxID=225164 RepID=V4A853_LOTGI|nr:hypothetical protein LOTGIDRAFT_162365 [Lottia gigantea]ESO92887.1 hypothetical protein LOTGIDRAFT_162365 [Lottia gigantea]
MVSPVDWRPFIFGGLASMTAESGTFPIDTTKTRLQIQGQVIDTRLTELKYRGMTHALFRIFKEEGFYSLYSGIAPALLRQATYGTIKIGGYQNLKRLFSSDPKNEKLSINVFCGIVAGVISSFMANPTDVLKVRLQAQGSSRSSDSMFRSFMKIYQSEGIPGLWRGVGPNAQRAAVVAGVELPAYDVCKKHIIRSGYLGDSIETHFLAAFFAGFVGTVASNPIDVVKTRLMNQQKLKVTDTATGNIPKIYTSSFDCFVKTIKTEGFLALYKGFIPTWVRLGPWNIIVSLNKNKSKKFKRRKNSCFTSFVLSEYLIYLA